MKYFYLFAAAALFVSCKKERTAVAGTPVVPPVVNPPATPVSFVSCSINGRYFYQTEVQKTRGGGAIRFEAVFNTQKVEIVVERITQTGNNTGIVLIGFYKINYYVHSDGGWALYETRKELLAIYNNLPLTDKTVTGTFSAEASTDGFKTGIPITNGSFQLSF